MTTTTAAMESPRDEGGIPQYGLPMILFMFAWPAAWFGFMIYVIGPLFLLRPDGTLPTWGFHLWWNNLWKRNSRIDEYICPN